MAKVNGDMRVMTLTDVMQWVDMSQKSGVLTLTYEDISRTIYLHEGNIVFTSSTQSGSRLGDVLITAGVITERQCINALNESQKLETPFTAYLIDLGLVDKDRLEGVIRQFSEFIIVNAIKWNGGFFEFSDALPPAVLNGPIKINVSSILFNSVKVVDESGRD